MVHALSAWLLIWSAYGFRFSAHDTPRNRLLTYGSLPEVVPYAGRAGAAIAWLGQWHALPEAYLYGSAYVLAKGRERPAFFKGEYSTTGWWYYFPYCALVKTPLALLGLLVASALWIGLRTRYASPANIVWNITPLLIFLTVYWAVAVTSNLNIGHRHLLPTYPAMFILAGGAARWFQQQRAYAMIVGLLAIAFAAECVRAYPDYLAYFNPLVPRQMAYRHLIDSNVDWGQDLPGLKRWLESPQASIQNEPVYLSYFGTGSPKYYRIRATRLPIKGPEAQRVQLVGGIYCISATDLQAVYMTAPGRWNVSYETDYQTMAALLRAPPENIPEQELQLVRDGMADLQFARLFAFLRQREPDHQIGYSILIYRLSDADVKAALEGPPAGARSAQLEPNGSPPEKLVVCQEDAHRRMAADRVVVIEYSDFPSDERIRADSRELRWS